MAVTTSEAFFELLIKSKLLSSDDLVEAQDATGDLADPRHIAARLIEHEWITRWQAQQLLAGRSAMHLGKYTLLELLGSGSKGRVYLAEHKQMGRRVALKTINPPSDGSIGQLLSKIRTVFALDHRNIIHIYDVDRHGSHYYLVMEYADGQDLQQFVNQNGPLEFDAVADYMHQTAQGLEHAHNRGIYHHDLKPANLLVDMQGTVKILDIGVAGLDEAERNGSTQEAINYRSPEQVLDSGQIDNRTDIFSLGSTCYFLLTGHPPFSEEADARQLMKLHTKGPIDILQKRSDTPAELISICQKMMSTRPNDRYATAQEAGEALGTWLQKYWEEHPREVAATPVIPSIQTSGQPSALAGAPIFAADGASTGTPGVEGSGGYATVPARRKTNNTPIIIGAVAAAVLLLGLIVIMMSGTKDDKNVVKKIGTSKKTKKTELVARKTNKRPKPFVQKTLLVDAISRGDRWDYFDKINTHKSPPDNYPVDNKSRAWNDLDFDTSSSTGGTWKSGAAILGYGKINVSPVVTKLDFGGKQENKFITYLFRNKFNVADVTGLNEMELNVLADDGVVIYLNGTEVGRINMPPGKVGTTTFTLAKGSEDKYHRLNVDLSRFPGLLHRGANCVAVEVHQSDLKSTDLGFDLALKLNTTRPIGDDWALIKSDKPGLSFPMPPPLPLTNVIAKNSTWKYWTLSDPDKTWFEKDFDDSAWQEGAAGFGSHGEKTNLQLKDKNFTRIYIRKKFDANNYRDQAKAMGLMARFDDAFIAYLNGKEVIRAFVGLHQGAEASEITGAGHNNYEYFPIHDWKKHLVPGANVIAIEAHNNTDTYRGHRGGDRMMIDPYLVAQVKPELIAKTSTKTKDPANTQLAKTNIKTPPPKKASSGTVVDDTNLLAEWNFNDPDNPGLDSTDKGNHATVSGATWVEKGHHGGALSFDGKSFIYASIARSANEDFTWVAWIKTSQKDGSIIAKASLTGNWSDGARSFFIRGGKLAFDTLTRSTFNGKTVVSDNQWHHVAMTYQSQTDGDKDTTKMYVDGKLDGEKSDKDLFQEDKTLVYKVGATSDNKGGYFKGLIDDPRIYAQALNSDEIRSLFEAEDPEALKGPFRDLPGAVELPSLAAANKPVDLGTVYEEPKKTYFVSLLGGEQALKGKQSFSLEPVDLDPEKILHARDWLIKLHSGSPRPGGGVTVARFELKGQKLSFQWTDKGIANETVCKHLQHCLVNLQSGKAKHILVLRKPVLVEPLVLNFSEKVAVPFKFEPPSNPKSLLIEITKLEGEFPEHLFGPRRVSAATAALPNRVFAPRDQMLIGLGGKIPDEKDKDKDKMVYPLGFSITYTPKQLNLLTYYQMSNDQRPVRYSDSQITRGSKRATAQFNNLPGRITRLETIKTNSDNLFKQAEKFLKKLASPDSPQKKTQKKRLEQQRDHYKKQRDDANGQIGSDKKKLKAAQKATVLFPLIKKFHDALNGTGKIHFRIYHQVEGHRVNLVVTKAPKRETAPKKP